MSYPISDKNRKNFWGDNPSILLQNNRLTSFFPSAKLSVVENLNSIVRLLFYLSIVLVLYTKNSQYIFLPLGGLFVTYIIYYLYPRKKDLEKFNITYPDNKNLVYPDINPDRLRKTCILPTTDNPFMNFNYITDNYHREPACKAFLYDDEKSQDIKEEVTESFNHNLYRDVGDLYSKNNSQRQFFTMPWTSWPNDQTSFAKWLYKTGPTCKELGSKCAPYWNPTTSRSVLEN